MNSLIPLPWKAILLAVGGAAASLSLAAAENYDVLIRGGRLLDGTGTPWRYADVAIRGDRVVAVGPIPVDATATRVVQARGKYVSPGFIDPHSHAAPGIGTASLAAALPILYQGITTVMINPDGGGPADLTPQLEAIRKNVPGVNVVPMIGHNGVRISVMAYENRAPTAEELKKMESYVRAAMELGAFGFSSGPFYVPGKFSKTDEIIALAKVAARFPGSFYISHIRDESSYDVGVVAAVDEVIEISRAAKIPGVVTHIKCIGPSVWGRSKVIIDHINAARAEGLEIWADQYAYSASGTGLQASLVPGWVQAGGQQAMTGRLSNPEQRTTIRQEMGENLERRAGAHNIMIRHYAADPSLEGKRLDDIARARLEDPLDTAIGMLIKGGASIISFNMSDPDLVAFMRQPWMMTCTDGSLGEFGKGNEHPRAYGAFPRKLRRYSLDQNIITIEQAVHASSGLTAAVFGIRDRGEVRVGAYADVLVWDPRTITDVATYEKPHAYSKGMDYIFVNGRAAVVEGKATDGRHGRVLLRQKQD